MSQPARSVAGVPTGTKISNSSFWYPRVTSKVYELTGEKIDKIKINLLTKKGEEERDKCENI